MTGKKDKKKKSAKADFDAVAQRAAADYETLRKGYAENYMAPFCRAPENGGFVGDVLAYDAAVEKAAIRLNVYISRADLPVEGSDETMPGLLLEHNPELCPVANCNHEEKCCMKARRPGMQ